MTILTFSTNLADFRISKRGPYFYILLSGQDIKLDASQGEVMLFSLLKKSEPNRRQSKRLSANADLHCLVSYKKNGACNVVQMIDISESGFSFYIPAELFEIGEKIEIQFGFANEHLLQTNAQIRSQHVYFPYGPDQFKKAVYRISGTFEKPIDSVTIMRICQTSQAA